MLADAEENLHELRAAVLTHCDGCLGVRVAGVVLQQLQQRVGAKALAALQC